MNFRKLLCSTALICLLGVNAEAAQINTIVDTGSGMFAEPEKVYNEIDETIKNWFTTSNMLSRHNLVPIADSDGVVQIYREEKGAALNTDEMVTGTQARDVSMSKQDLNNISKELGSDYIMYFRVTNTAPTATDGFMTSGQKVNVTTDFRVWSTKENKYVFVKRYQTSGSSTSFYYGSGSASKAVRSGLRKALKKIGEDKVSIMAVIQ